MNRLVIYIHGKGGNAKEAEHYKPLFPKDDVIVCDYQSQKLSLYLQKKQEHSLRLCRRGSIGFIRRNRWNF